MAEQHLGEFELLIMLAVLQTEDEPYAVSIRREIEERTSRSVTRGAVYATLDRLEKKGFLSSRLSEPTPERGGKAKRLYAVEAPGLEAVRASRAMMRAMWRGLDGVLEAGT